MLRQSGYLCVSVLANFLFAHVSPSMAAQCSSETVAISNLPDNEEDRRELSGIATVTRLNKELAYIVSDEFIKGAGNTVQIFAKHPGNSYHFHDEIDVTKNASVGDDCEEADLEGLAISGDHIYAISSHSLSRKTPKPNKTVVENKKRIEKLKFNKCDIRKRIYKVDIKPDGNLGDVTHKSLIPFFGSKKFLKRFLDIPSKENGIDIEGLAAKDGHLFAGLRGPVLRKDFVPIIRFEFDEPKNTAKLLYVNLGGQGIRSLEAVDDHFLILSGPVGGHSDKPFSLYRWDGESMVRGKDKPSRGKLDKLCSLEEIGGAKPEGLAVLESSNTKYVLLVVYDSKTEFVVRSVVVPR